MNIRAWVNSFPVAERSGAIANLAAQLSVTPPAVRHWIAGLRKVRAEQCGPIETATEGKVTRYDLRPDIFGAKPSRKKVA